MKLLIVIGCIAAFFLLSRFLERLVRELAIKRSVTHYRAVYISRLLRYATLFCAVSVGCLVLGLGYADVALFLSSVFAVVGIALFAQWSILSNITASVIIFFGFPYRIGDRVRVIDPDLQETGEISHIGTFHVILRLDDGNSVIYPNSMMLQKPVVKLNGKELATEPDGADGEAQPARATQ